MEPGLVRAVPDDDDELLAEGRGPPMLTRDDILRQTALQMALDHHARLGGQFDVGQIVKDADIFLQFLKG